MIELQIDLAEIKINNISVLNSKWLHRYANIFYTTFLEEKSLKKILAPFFPGP